MQTVVLDTNALLMPFEIGINLDAEVRSVLGEVRFVVPGPLIGELKRLQDTNRYAKAALALARSREIVQCETSGDDAVIEAAEREHGYILTNDKELRRRARKLLIPLLFLRSNTHLELETYRTFPDALFGTSGSGARDLRTCRIGEKKPGAGLPAPEDV